MWGRSEQYEVKRGLSYPGGVKREKELKGAAAFAGWRALFEVCGG
jgi:hypothetical protein